MVGLTSRGLLKNYLGFTVPGLVIAKYPVIREHLAFILFPVAVRCLVTGGNDHIIRKMERKNPFGRMWNP